MGPISREPEPVRTAVLEQLAPQDWQQHRFGLPAPRWHSLSESTIWVTGAGTGFGQAVACALATAGCRVILTGRRERQLHRTISLACSLNAPGRLEPLPADLTDPEQIDQAARRVGRWCGALDGLVHCAAVPGNCGPYPLQDAPLALWQTTMDTNVRGPWLLTRAVFDLLLSSDAVRVLLMSSGAGWGYRVGTGLYNISKAALNSLCHSLAHEFAERYPRRDVQINGILPGIARTEMNPDATESPFSAVSIVLLLLTHPPGGPNGRFFHRDGRHIEFGASLPYPVALQGGTGEQCGASGGTG